MDIDFEKAGIYADKYSSLHNNLLEKLLAFTNTHAHAHLASSPLQGRFLAFISHMLQPENILEIGTFTGFSALCLAEGLKKNGELHTIELRKEDAEIAQVFFNESEFKSQIHLHRGNAAELIPGINKAWDLIFIDADKTGYINYYDLTLPHLKKGGFILADNVLFHGEVLAEEVKGKNAIAIQAFNEYVATDDRVEQVILTIRDGLMLIRKR